jgi:hypothetical protein
MAAMFKVGVARSRIFRIEWRAAHEQQTRPSFVANKRKPGANGVRHIALHLFFVFKELEYIRPAVSCLTFLRERLLSSYWARYYRQSGICVSSILTEGSTRKKRKKYFTGVLPELYPQVRRPWSCRALEMKKEARSIEIEIRTCVDDYKTILYLLWAALTCRTAV